MLVSQVIASPNPLPLNLWGAHGRQRNWGGEKTCFFKSCKVSACDAGVIRELCRPSGRRVSSILSQRRVFLMKCSLRSCGTGGRNQLLQFPPRNLIPKVVPQCVSPFVKWLVAPKEELAKMMPAPVEPIDPQRCLCAEAKETADGEPDRQEDSEEEEEEDDDDIGGDALPSSSRSQQPEAEKTCKARSKQSSALETDTDPSVLKKAFKEFSAAFLEIPADTDEEELLDSVAFILKTVHSISAAAPGSGKSADFLLPAASFTQLQASYAAHRQGARQKRKTQTLTLSLALACLEELRLLAPFPCGQDFCEVLSHVAAPYCFSQQGNVEESSEAAQFFCKFDLGRHWLWPYLEHAPLDCLRKAAACVLQAADIRSDGALLQRCFLPCNLVAPCAWVHARGTLNVPVLRCLVLRLLQQLLKAPLASVPEQLGAFHSIIIDNGSCGGGGGGGGGGSGGGGDG